MPTYCGPGGQYNTMPDERVDIADYLELVRILDIYEMAQVQAQPRSHPPGRSARCDQRRLKGDHNRTLRARRKEAERMCRTSPRDFRFRISISLC